MTLNQILRQVDLATQIYEKILVKVSDSDIRERILVWQRILAVTKYRLIECYKKQNLQPIENLHKSFSTKLRRYKYELDIICSTIRYVELESVSSLRKRINLLKSAIEAIVSVNTLILKMPATKQIESVQTKIHVPKN
ncbi:MAG: hypothetical protein NZO16_06845 [Deltaproteobacteria bacterium]|nr:hypothetical protein [Deltaproteobacteria bacterium]